jgi:hypothetical protein
LTAWIRAASILAVVVVVAIVIVVVTLAVLVLVAVRRGDVRIETRLRSKINASPRLLSQD